MDEPDSSSAAKSSEDENSENVNKTSTSTTDVYDFDSQEALKKAKVDRTKKSVKLQHHYFWKSQKWWNLFLVFLFLYIQK